MNFKLVGFTYAGTLSGFLFCAGYGLRYTEEDHCFCSHYLIGMAHTDHHPEIRMEEHEQSQEPLSVETDHVVRSSNDRDSPDRYGLG